MKVTKSIAEPLTEMVCPSCKLEGFIVGYITPNGMDKECMRCNHIIKPLPLPMTEIEKLKKQVKEFTLT